MSNDNLPLNNGSSLDDDDVSVVSSSSLSSPKPNLDPSSLVVSSFHYPSNLKIRLQESLLILIHLHLMKLLLISSLKVTYADPRRPFLCLKENLPTLMKKVGHVSHRFFESTCLAVKVFFQSNTFPVTSSDLSQLCSFASFFGAEVQSVFLHVDGTFNVEELLNYSQFISGLEVTLQNDNHLKFVNNSSYYFPRLKQLDVRVEPGISMSFIELLKVNNTILVSLIFKYLNKRTFLISILNRLLITLNTETPICYFINFDCKPWHTDTSAELWYYFYGFGTERANSKMKNT
ncbi:hypothetical protein GEMRC1_009678 [Eukaryota sp. GEM-RC1]